MQRGYKLTHEEKLELLPDICFLLEMAHGIVTAAINIDMIQRVNNSSDEFLKYGYALIINGLEPKVAEKVLDILVHNEPDDFKRFKMHIQKDVLLAMQEIDSFNVSALIVISYMGLDFKDDLIKYLKIHMPHIHNELLNTTNFDKYNLDETIKRLKANPFN